MNKPVIFYHLWREGDWRTVNKQILTKIVESGLIDSVEMINICVNDRNEVNDIPLCGVPVDKIAFHNVNATGTEWPTLDLMYESYSTIPSTPILYVHSKGASYPTEHPLKAGVTSWVDGLLYYLVEEWYTCLSMLRMGGICVGANKSDLQGVHFSGNFWWIMSDALRSLPNPKLQDQSYGNRFGAEFWIGGLGGLNLKNNGLVGFDYRKVIPRSAYASSSRISRNDRNVCVHVDSNLDISSFKSVGIPHDVYSNGLNSYAKTYLEYIIDNYERLPEYNYFVRTSQLITHVPNLFDIVENGTPTEFEFMTKGILNADVNGAPHHPGLPLERFWEAVFPEYTCPTNFEFGAGSQFIVHRDKILMNSLDFYVNVSNMISNRVGPVEDFILERMWKDIFSEKVMEVSDFDLRVYIFNYNLIDKAVALKTKFDEIGVEAHILDSYSGNEIPEDVDDIHEYENVYYSGLWNEALNIFDGSHMMVVTSDVDIPDPLKLVNNAKQFFKSDKTWIYAPNVNYTFWDYDEQSLPDYSRNVKIVPNTDGMCWILSSDAAFAVGNIDNDINKIGFGVDLLAAMMAKREDKIVGRDYSITVHHPQTRAYDSTEAERQEFEWINSLGYLPEYTQYRNYYAMSFLK